MIYRSMIYVYAYIYIYGCDPINELLLVIPGEFRSQELCGLEAARAAAKSAQLAALREGATAQKCGEYAGEAMTRGMNHY